MMEISSSEKGTVSEMIACADLTRRGFDVFRAINPHAPFDLMVHKRGQCFKVEVKTIKIKPNGSRMPRFSPRDNTKFDILALVFNKEVFYDPEFETLMDLVDSLSIKVLRTPHGPFFVGDPKKS